MNMEELLDQLDELLDKGMRFPGGRTVVESEKVRALIDDMRLNMPQEVKQARGIVADRADIINNAKRDAEAFDLELILADIEIVERRLERAKKNAKSGDKKYKRECEMCEALIAHLTDEKPARSFEFTDEDSDILVDGGLLTVKPVIYAANLDEDSMMNLDTNANFAALKKIADEQGAAVLPVAAKFEEDIAGMEPDEAEMFMADLGLTETGLDRLIKTSYDLLGYISFLTAGEDDVHAWTITRGTKAPKAAGKVHSDIERGFIRAEIVAFDDLKACGSMAAAKEKGLLRLEGKDYVMQDGDITNFRFNI